MAEEAYRRIEEMITSRALPPGTMISENQLREELDCGRTPIREALQRLKLEGYVEVHPRRGVQVRPVDVLQQLKLLEVRRALEELMARLASERATGEERERLRGLAAAIRRAAEAQSPTYFEINRDIHRSLAAATHNETLVKSIGIIHGLSRRFWYAYIMDDKKLEASGLHATMLNAVADGDGDGAAAAASRLMDFLEKLTRSAIERL